MRLQYTCTPELTLIFPTAGMKKSNEQSRLSVRIYHNPRCSKSRQALALLEERGIEPEIIEYLKTPPDAAHLRALLARLDMPARDLLRKKEPEYKELGKAHEKISDREAIAAMVQTPKLMERPVVVVNDSRGVIARPPEALLELL